MSQETKANCVATDKMAGQHNEKRQDAKAPAPAPEPPATKPSPPDDAMIQQILERQAVFGF